MCRWGFSNIVKTLKNVRDDRVRAYIVWLPIFGGDFRGEARKLSSSFLDKRVSYFLDPESETGKQWKQALKIETVIAWDVYMLYGPNATWSEEPPRPEFWMHQLGGVTRASRYDEPAFRSRLKGMLVDMKEAAASKTHPRAKVEFLYFKSCPGHKKALINLKAALRESKTEADLVLISVTSEAQAAKVGFQGSPSIRVNGRDLDGRNEGHSFGCRIYTIDGKITPIPSKKFVEEKLKQLMFGRPHAITDSR